LTSHGSDKTMVLGVVPNLAKGHVMTAPTTFRRFPMRDGGSTSRFAKACGAWISKAVVTVCALSIASCGATHSPSTSSSNPGASRLNARFKESPGRVAVDYVKDLYSDHLSAARLLILPQDWSTFNVVAAVISHNRVSAQAVSIGSIQVKGTRAVVMLRGTFCSAPGGAAPSGTATTLASVCITSSALNNTNKALRVTLTHAGSRWYVYFPIPRSTPTAQAAPTPSHG
jgi:hypothetical protein